MELDKRTNVTDGKDENIRKLNRNNEEEEENDTEEEAVGESSDEDLKPWELCRYCKKVLSTTRTKNGPENRSSAALSNDQAILYA